MKKCQNCGTKNADSAKQCNFCEAILPEKQPVDKKESAYIHDEATEKKKTKKKIILFSVVGVLIFSAIIAILIIIFTTGKETKSEKLYGVLENAITEERSFSGTLKSKDKDISFVGNVKDSQIFISFKNCEYDSAVFSKDGLTFTKGEEKITADESMDCYDLYIAYLLITSAGDNVFQLQTEDIRNDILPLVKSYITEDFDNTFYEDSFIGSVFSILTAMKDEQNIKTYMGMTLPDDIENGEFGFDISSYDLQNFILGEFKKAFKDSSKYDEVNQNLKDAKSSVKSNFKAEGSFTTKDGKLESASCEMKYKGIKYTLSLSFE